MHRAPCVCVCVCVYACVFISLYDRMWEHSKFVARQLDGVGAVYSKALSRSGMTSFRKLREASVVKIESVC